MRRVGFICLALLAALGILGIGYAQWSKNVAISAQVSTAPAPVLGSPSASVNVSGNSVTLSGTLTSLGTADSVTTLFKYGTVPGILDQQTIGGTMYGSGTFNANITSLTPGTTYYYQSQVQGLYTVSSDIGSFVYKGPLAMQATLPAGQVNVAYSGHLTVSGGTSPYNISATGLSGTGLSVDPSTGAVSGTPGSVGTITFNVTITDSATPTNNTLPSGQLSIVIKPAVNGLNHIAITPNSPSVITSGQVTFAAQAYDSGNNPISNPSYTWSCSDATAGTINSSGVFAAGSTTGTYTNVITAKSGSVTGYASVTVTGGTADHISIETSPYGSGIVVPSQTLTSGNAITVYAISRDASNNFIANVAVTWSLTNINTGVVSGDLVPSGDTKSAVFTGHVAGSATIHIINGSSTADSGTITVTAGAATKLAFTQLPSSSPASTNFVTQVTVEDTYGNIVTNPSIPITLAIGTNPSGGTLTVSGGNPINSLNGVAAFSGVSINWAGTYTLTATSGTLTVTSSSFNITAIIRTWTGTGTNDNFSAANHWTGNSVPGVGDSLIIISPGTYYCNFDNTANNFVYGTLSLGSGSTPGTLQWPAGGTNTLQVTNINPAIVGSKIDMTNGGTLQVSGSWTTTNMTFTRGTGTVNYNGAAQTVAAFTYNNLTLSGSGAKTLGAATTSISGNLILSDTATTTTGAALAIGGNLIIGNGTTFATGATNTWTLTVSGTTSVSQTLTLANTGAKIFAGLVTINAGGTWNNSGNSPVTFRGGITNNGTFTAGSGIYTFGTNSQALTGTFIIPSVTVTGVTLTNNGSLTVATALTGTGGLTNSATRTLNIGGTCSITTLTNAGTATITNTSGGAISTILANFTNTGIINLNGTGTIAGITNNAAGIVNLNSSGIITSFNNAAATSTLNISASPVPTITTLTATFAGNTMNYTGTGAQTVKATTYYNLGFSGARDANNITINGIVGVAGTLTNIATFGTGNFVLTGSTITYNGTGAQTVTNLNYNNLTLSGGGAKTLDPAMATIGGTLTLSGTASTTTVAALTIGGNLVVGTGTTFATGTTNTCILGVTGTTSITGTLTIANTGTQTFTGAVTVNSGGTLTESAAAVVAIAGSLTNNGTYTASTGVHTFSGAAKTISGTSIISIPTATFTGAYTNSGTLTVGTLLTIIGVTLTNNGTITATAALSGTGGLTQGTNATLNIGSTSGITTLTATAAGNTVNYIGAVQTIHSNSYYYLTLSGSGAKTMGSGPSATSVTGKMTIASPAKASILAGVGINVRALFFGSANQAVGTWGYSGRNHNDTTYFDNTTGYLIVAAVSPITSTAAGGLWTAPTTWLGGIAPNGNDDVVIATTTVNSVTLGAALTQYGTLTINSGATLTETAAAALSFGADVNINGTLTEFGAAVVGFAGNLTKNGTYTASSGIHTFSGSGKTISGTSIISIPTATFTGAYTNSGTLTVGTLLTITGVTLTNNGTITATTALSGTGGLTNGTTGMLNIGGTSGITTLTATASGNTVNYFMGGQTVKSTNYYNLTLSGTGTDVLQAGTTVIGGTLTLSGTISTTMVTGLTISGNLNIGTGTTLAASTYALNVSGDWSNSGTFTCGTGTVTLNGSSVQTIGGSTATTFYNLILSGSGAKTIPSGTVISNNLSIAPTGSATASIAAGANITANTLTLGGTLKPGTNATWGSTASAATNKNDTYFTTGTTGYLTVAH